MSGQLTAALSAVAYAVSYMFLRKAQTQSKTDELDNGLFSILFVGGFTLCACLFVTMGLDSDPVVKGHDWHIAVVFCILSGISGTLFGRLALFAAIARIGATRGVIINAMAPLITLGIAVTVLGERFRPNALAGMGFLGIGICLLLIEHIWFPTRLERKWFQNGVLIAVLATCFQGLGYTFRKVGIDTSMTPLFAAALDMNSALTGYCLVLLFTRRFGRVIRASCRPVSLYLVASGLLTALAILCFFVATDEIPVSLVSIITATQPVIVALLSGLFLRRLERLTWVTILCSLSVTAGVILIGM